MYFFSDIWVLLVYESRGLLYPFTCACAVVATPATMLGGAEEAKIQDHPSSTEARGAKSKGTKWVSPGKSLAGDDLRYPGKSLPWATFP